jgi:hypothetical protein
MPRFITGNSFAIGIAKQFSYRRLMAPYGFSTSVLLTFPCKYYRLKVIGHLLCSNKNRRYFRPVGSVAGLL